MRSRLLPFRKAGLTPASPGPTGRVRVRAPRLSSGQPPRHPFYSARRWLGPAPRWGPLLAGAWDCIAGELGYPTSGHLVQDGGIFWNGPGGARPAEMCQDGTDHPCSSLAPREAPGGGWRTPCCPPEWAETSRTVRMGKTLPKTTAAQLWSPAAPLSAMSLFKAQRCLPSQVGKNLHSPSLPTTTCLVLSEGSAWQAEGSEMGDWRRASSAHHWTSQGQTAAEGASAQGADWSLH